MRHSESAERVPRVRVADFTELGVSAHARLQLQGRTQESAVRELRRHADLPYVFVAMSEQWELVAGVLSRLRETRSPCYPYAVFLLGGDGPVPSEPDLDVVTCESHTADAVSAEVERYALSRFTFDLSTLELENPSDPPARVDVLIVGAGAVGLHAADRLRGTELSFCVLERREVVGGIWSQYANASSQVNTSEGAYRLCEHTARANRDHSGTAEILNDIRSLATGVDDRLFTRSTVTGIAKTSTGYRTTFTRAGEKGTVESRGVILAVNDRVGSPRTVIWPDEDRYTGTLVNGISGEADQVSWDGKRVVVVGMGAFAVENVRTALEAGAAHVTVVCRRHGTVCPKIIDYLNFSAAYDERFRHDRKSNMRNMLLWKRLYEQSGATEPECWMGKMKHEGHTISVSDIWFIGHYLKKLETQRATVAGMYERGVVLADGRRVEADVVVKCVGFERNASAARELSGYSRMYNTNYIDQDFMYIADAYLDDDVFNSFFGSSVLEMAKFYMEVYLRFFGDPAFERHAGIDGVDQIDIDDRRWSHYITGAEALMDAYPELREAALTQIERRTRNFLDMHDLPAYVEANRREWLDTHRLLAGRPMSEDECLPYVFEKLTAGAAR